MTNITESPSWEDEISLIARSERVSGGQDGAANRPLKSLANRTRFLKEATDSAVLELSGKVEAVKSFTEGAELLSPRDEILYGNLRLVWTGVFPKVVPADATPYTTGGGWAGAVGVYFRCGSPSGYGLIQNARYINADALRRQNR